MVHYRRVGQIPQKRHTQFRRPDGGLYAEELMGTEGFSNDSALLYHRHLPTAITDAQPWDAPDTTTVPNHPLKPRHFRTPKVTFGPAESTDAVTGRRLLLGNTDARIWFVVAGRPSPLYRNAIGDECAFVEAGTARLETVFGALDVGPGDYVILPTSTTHRWVPTGTEPVRLTGFEHHGFLNVLLAAAAAQGGADLPELTALLALRDGTAVADRVRSLGRSGGTAEATGARGLFHAFGSCEFDEPVDDLVQLGLLDQG